LFNVSNPLSPFLEVVVEEGKVVDVEEKVETKESVEESKPRKTIEKCSSYKEESNFLSDLKEFEKKALIELKSKLEEAILGNTLFEKKEEEAKKVEALPEGGEEGEKVVKEEEEEKKVEEEEKKEEDKDLFLWGVSLLPSKGNEGIDVVLLKFFEG
jgi:hypothetical protein